MADSVLSGPDQAKTKQNKTLALIDVISLHIVPYRGKDEKGNLIQSTPITRTFKGNRKNFEFSGVQVIVSLKRIVRKKTGFTTQ